METRKMSEDLDDACILCCRSANIFAIGECDHAVCYECSTRMRVLCRQNECPICRRDMPRVVFTKVIQPFQNMCLDNLPLDQKYRIHFKEKDDQEAFWKLLEHVCKICPLKIFKNFNLLKEHMRKDHELFYCDICVKHLRIFTHERKEYSRQELGRHRRQGDIDDTSHRGHPLCKFCDERFLDSDELFRHMRKEHYFCHFCDADGQHQYYSDYECLRDHFHLEHFLCEEGQCREERFTHVFRTDIDLKAHKAQHHSRNLSKAQARQARTLELEFTFAPRQRTGADFHETSRGRRARGGSRGKSMRHVFNERDEDEISAVDLSTSLAQSNHPPDLGATGKNRPKDDDFPLLDGSLPNKKNETSDKMDSRFYHDTLAKKLARHNNINVQESQWNSEQFPCLGNMSNQIVVSQSSSRPNATSNLPSSPNSRKTLLFRFNSQEDFPTLGGNSDRRTPNVSIQVGRNQVNISTGRRASVSEEVVSNSQPLARQNIQITQNGPNSISIARNWEEDFPNLGTGHSQGSSNYATSKSNVTKNIPGANSKANNLSDVSNIKTSHANVNKMLNNYSPSLYSTKTSHVTIPVNWPESRDKSPSSESESSNTKQKKKKPKTKAINSKEQSTKDLMNLEPNRKKKKPPETKNIENQENKNPQNKSVENSNDIKRTEIRIESSGEEQNNNQLEAILLDSVDEFPALPLSSARTPGLTPPPPPGFSNSVRSAPPPPGFSSTNSTTTNSRAPPGFKTSCADSVPIVDLKISAIPSLFQVLDSNVNSSTAWPCGTFPLSSPQTYVFRQPRDYHTRNQQLVQRILDILESDEDNFNEFKILSSNYRQGNINALEYYEKCSSLLSEDKFYDIFPELIYLLPDIQKQQYLVAAHTAAAKKSGMPEEKNPGKHFMVCATCRQVLSSKDFASHMLTHTMDQEFPSLSSTKSVLSTLVRSK